MKSGLPNETELNNTDYAKGSFQNPIKFEGINCGIDPEDEIFEKVCLLCDDKFETEFVTDLICEDCKIDFAEWKQRCDVERQIARMVNPRKPSAEEMKKVLEVVKKS